MKKTLQRFLGLAVVLTAVLAGTLMAKEEVQAQPMTPAVETMCPMAYWQHGGFGGMAAKIGMINKDFAVVMGARGAWLINKTFTFGFGGYGSITETPVDSAGAKHTISYGGFEAGYIIEPNRALHCGLRLLLGSGGVDGCGSKNSFFAMEAGVDAELNITDWMRVNLGASYLFGAGAKFEDPDDKYINGFFGAVAVNFGGF